MISHTDFSLVVLILSLKSQLALQDQKNSWKLQTGLENKDMEKYSLQKDLENLQMPTHLPKAEKPL